MDAQGFLLKKRDETLRRYYNQRNDYANTLDQGAATAEDVNQARNAQTMGEMTGGFSRDRAIQRGLNENNSVLNREYNENVTVINNIYDIQKKTLDEEKAAQDKANSDAKIGNMIKSATGIVGGVASRLFPGVGTLAGGLLSTAGQALGSGISGQSPDFNFDFLNSWHSYKNAGHYKYFGTGE